jgi:CBS domain-containing protein
MQHYKLIEIFADEAAHWRGEPLYKAIVQFVRELKIAARCLVTRGIEGVYESGEIATSSLEVLSYNMPVRITIITPLSEAEKILTKTQEMVIDGMVTVQDLQVISHRTQGQFIPRQMRVQELMTLQPEKANLETSLADVARLLLSSRFTGLPVVDAGNRPVGVISQGDLIYKAGMPMRLGLLAETDNEKVSAVLEALSPRQAREIMTTPAVTIRQEQFVTEAVNLMLQKKVTRLPVVDTDGKLVGNLSRVDVFHTILRECPDWQAFQKQQITVENLRFVSDIMRRDTTTVLPDTSVEEVIRLIACGEMPQVGVVDQEGNFLGLISDLDLLAAFDDRHPGIWDYFVSKLPFIEKRQRDEGFQQHLEGKTASEVMNTTSITVQKNAPIHEAIRLMLENGIKHLPVLDEQGKFKGMVSREALLRTGFASSGTEPGRIESLKKQG